MTVTLAGWQQLSILPPQPIVIVATTMIERKIQI